MPPKPSPASERETAKRLSEVFGFNVTRQQIRELKKKGVDLTDEAAIEKAWSNSERRPAEHPKKAGKKKAAKKSATRKRATKKKAKAKEAPDAQEDPKLSADSVEDDLSDIYKDLKEAEEYDEARTLRTKMSGIKDLLAELREQEKYILKEDALRDGARAALAVRGELEKLEDSLPPILEGLTSLQMKAKIRDYVRGVMLELANLFEK